VSDLHGMLCEVGAQFFIDETKAKSYVVDRWTCGAETRHQSRPWPRRDPRRARRPRHLCNSASTQGDLDYLQPPVACFTTMLAIPDVIAWCWARGGDWRHRIAPIVTATIRVW